MKMTRSLVAVAALALALPLAACSSDKSEDPGSASSAAATAAAPTDGQEVTASTAGITFLAPSDWTVLSDPSSLGEDALSAAAEAVGQDPATYKNSMKQVDLLVSNPEARAISGVAFADNILVARQSVPESQVPADETSATAFAKATGANNMTKYEKIGTANGEATVVHYDMTVKDGTGYGAVVFAPTSDGSYAAITASATEASTVDELVARVTGSVK